MAAAKRVLTPAKKKRRKKKRKNKGIRLKHRRKNEAAQKKQ